MEPASSRCQGAFRRRSDRQEAEDDHSPHETTMFAGSEGFASRARRCARRWLCTLARGRRHRRHHLAGRLPGDRRRVARQADDRLRRRRARHAHAGDLHARQQRHAVRRPRATRSGRMQAFAQFFADSGYSPSELWGLGYEGDQCDLGGRPTTRGARAYRAHQRRQRARPAPLRRRGAGLHRRQAGGHRRPQPGRDVAREWMRQDECLAHRAPLRRDRWPEPRHHQLLAEPGRTTTSCPRKAASRRASEVCQELGSPDTPFLQAS